MAQFAIVIALVVQVFMIAMLSGMEMDRNLPQAFRSVVRMLIIAVTVSSVALVCSLVVL